MRVFTFLLVIVPVIFAAIPAHAQVMRRVLEPSAESRKTAGGIKAEVFRLAPRGMFDSASNEMQIRGGGAYFSFRTKSHDYNRIPQIQLQGRSLSVGFAGADYGLIADLGEIPLESVGAETGEVRLLLDYRAITEELSARDEYQKLHLGIEIGGAKFTRQVDAVAGHSYALRAISFRDADTLVVFHVSEISDDDSATILWKHVKEFDVPVITRATPEERIERAKKALSRIGLAGIEVSFDTATSSIVLKGTVAKGRSAIALQAVREASHSKVVNAVTESADPRR